MTMLSHDSTLYPVDPSFGLGKQTLNIHSVWNYLIRHKYLSVFNRITGFAFGLISKSLKYVIDKLWVSTSPSVTVQ